MKLPPEFPRRMRQARISAGMTQSDLAAAAGMHAVALGRIERGVDHPRAGTVRAICRAMGASADYLLCLNETERNERKTHART